MYFLCCVEVKINLLFVYHHDIYVQKGKKYQYIKGKINYYILLSKVFMQLKMKKQRRKN